MEKPWKIHGKSTKFLANMRAKDLDDLCYQICADWFRVEPLCVCSHHERNKLTRSSGRMWRHVCFKQVLVVVKLNMII